jgi:CBS domain-containing protein
MPTPATADELLASGSVALRQQVTRARDVAELAAAASRIAELAGAALDAGAGVAATTTAISALNDDVTVAVVRAVAAEMGVDLDRACWLAFGSQARGEQTIATDQDNGLVFAACADVDAERAQWMRFGQRVNEALASCGYPLCDGRVMAGQPLCCLTADEWCRRFEHWLTHGSANDLLAVRIYFDVRPLAGALALARPIRELLRSPAASVPRFVKQMADVVLCNHVPLNWWGAVVTARNDGRAMFDLKMSGTALFVDAARLWALAHAIDEVGTEARLRAAGTLLHAPPQEITAWVEGFQTLQRMRLDLQRYRAADADPEQRCWVAWDTLDAARRQALKRALHAARWVQQRIQLDYWR